MTENTRQTASTGTDSQNRYDIELTDVRGVGAKTVQKLKAVDINSIDDLHLIRPGRPTSKNRAQSKGITIGSDTWSHLEAVGNAVYSEGSTLVKAKHLTHPAATCCEDFSYLDITALDNSAKSAGDSDRSNENRQQMTLTADLPTETTHQQDSQNSDTVAGTTDTDNSAKDFLSDPEFIEAVTTVGEKYDNTREDELALTNQLHRYARSLPEVDPSAVEFNHGFMKLLLYDNENPERLAAMSQFSVDHAHLLIAFVDSDYIR